MTHSQGYCAYKETTLYCSMMTLRIIAGKIKILMRQTIWFLLLKNVAISAYLFFIP